MKKQNEQGIAHFLILLLLVIAIGGSGVYVYKHQKPTTTNNSQAETTDTNLTKPIPDNLLTTEKVQELASAKVTDSAKVEGVDLEKDNTVLKYRVHLSDGSFLLFNAKSGVLISKGTTTEQEEGLSELPAKLKPAITLDKAREIALGNKPAGVIRMIKLQKEHGVVLYSVRFTDGAKVDIDANSGQIIKTTGKTESKTESKNETENKTETHKTTETPKPSGGSTTTNSGSGEKSTSSGSGSGSGTDMSGSGSGSGSDSGGHHGTDG